MLQKENPDFNCSFISFNTLMNALWGKRESTHFYLIIAEKLLKYHIQKFFHYQINVN